MDSRLAAIISGIGAVMLAVAGVMLVVREVRRRERMDSLRTVTVLEQALDVCQNDAINWRQYVFGIRAQCADHGILTPEPPPLLSEEPDDGGGPDPLLLGIGHTGRRRRGLRRRRRSGEPADTDHGDDPGTPW